jgi:hypothetical protein
MPFRHITKSACLSHLRWGVEAFYKRLKYHQAVENISGKSVQVRKDWWVISLQHWSYPDIVT